jgi:hypothetical protein
MRLLKVKFCLSTSFLLKATAAIPFSVTAFKASVFFGSTLKDCEKRLMSSKLKRFSKRGLPTELFNARSSGSGFRFECPH